MRKSIFTIVLITISAGLFSQDFSVPANYKLEKAGDYALYEKDIIRCVDWLMNTPANEQVEKRKEANAFLLQWLSGSPYVHLAIKEEVVTFLETSPELLVIFLGGWAKYSLESKDYSNNVAGSLAGIESVLEYYGRNNSDMARDRNIEKYIKMKQKGKLEEYIEKNA